MDRDEIKECIKTALENGQLEEAAQIIEQYKKIIGYDDDVAGMEAILEIYNGNYDNAMLCIQKGLEHNIFNSDLYFTMGNIY
ncbi:tetratricopeptide repeat protein, partial [Inconstantimicrobium porci]|uniref:tetratricopeptide repeat protein n=1 Tax=Inconstantimicrobium porci TaxID=2652291 RepID=UPI00240A1C67